MDSLKSLDFSLFIIFCDDPWSLLVSFCQLFKLPLVVQCCNVICEWPLIFQQFTICKTVKIYLSITLRYPVSISTTFYVVTPRLLSLRWADHGCWQCWHARQGFYTPPTPSLWLQTLTHFVFFYTLHHGQLLVLVLVCRGSNNQVLCCGVFGIMCHWNLRGSGIFGSKSFPQRHLLAHLQYFKVFTIAVPML